MTAQDEHELRLHQMNAARERLTGRTAGYYIQLDDGRWVRVSQIIHEWWGGGKRVEP